MLARSFDAMIHVDETRALEPLEPPDTYPNGL
jgi:erythromycin esterase-like protein